MGLIGGGLVIIGSVMPWATITTAFGSISVAGTQGDGQITLVIGAVLALLSGLKLAGNGTPSALNILIVICAIGALAVAGIDMSNVQEMGGDLGGFAAASVGTGLYLILLGAIAGFFGAAGDSGKNESSPANPPVPAEQLVPRLPE